jgi:hypothetical protein
LQLIPTIPNRDIRTQDNRILWDCPSTDTLGDEGCAVTSAAMVATFYGIKTDPRQTSRSESVQQMITEHSPVQKAVRDLARETGGDPSR